MRIDGDLDIYLAGKLLDSYSMDNVLIEDCQVNGALKFSNTSNLTIRRLNLRGTMITNQDQIKDNLTACTNVTVE